jgi:SpoVK/Ycf46/Vps4 family AAA+-type ATPase
MSAAEQIKTLIKSFTDGDDDRFYATAMQMAAAEARKGNVGFAEELKNLIKSSKLGKSTNFIEGYKIKRLPVNTAQKELNDLLELIHPNVRLKDMVLDKNVKQSIIRILDEQKKSEILREHNLFPRKKILLAGSPGCGKTMTAHVIAKELGLPLFVVRLDGLISRYMGESISKLRLIFEAMHQFRAVYLFDEFDSIGSTRNTGFDVGEIKRVLNSFLLQIEKDDSNSLIIAATNLPQVLDDALFRRFDDLINYPLPTKVEISQLYKRILSNHIEKSNLIELISDKSINLSFDEIQKISEDYLKFIFIYNNKSTAFDQLLVNIEQRKNRLMPKNN